MPEEHQISPGITYVQFGDGEDIVEWMREQQEKVQARPLAREQQGIGYGDHAIRFIDGLLIFYYCPTLAEQDEDDEILYDVDYRQRTHNSLWVRGYSVITIAGEWGFVHRSTLWPIDAATFEAARLVDWQPEAMMKSAKDTVYLAAVQHDQFLKAGG